jgi:hypothetical protein
MKRAMLTVVVQLDGEAVVVLFESPAVAVGVRVLFEPEVLVELPVELLAAVAPLDPAVGEAVLPLLLSSSTGLSLVEDSADDPVVVVSL